jgi:hypothetical protein
VSLANSAKHYSDDLLRGRVRAAVLAKAIDVIGSTPRAGQATGVAAENANASRRLADLVIGNPDVALNAFVAVVANTQQAADATDASTISDGLINGAVGQAWQPIAATG